MAFGTFALHFAFFALFTALFLQANVFAVVKLTSSNCLVLEEGRNHVSVGYCRLKAIRRNYGEFTLKVNFLKMPLHNVTVQVHFLKRANGYRPFLYNLKFNGCRLLTSTNYPKPLQTLLYDLIKRSTNIGNHTCPWTQPYFAVERFGLNNDMFFLPIPSGSYRVLFKIATEGVFRFQGNLDFIKEDY